MVDRHKIALMDIKKAGFDISKIPEGLNLYMNHENFIMIEKWVIKLFNSHVINGNALGIYINIKDHCYGGKAYTWISKRKLAEKCGLSIRTTYRALNSLIKAGVLVSFTQKSGSNRSRTLIILMDKMNTKLASIRGPGGHRGYGRTSKQISVKSQNRQLTDDAESNTHVKSCQEKHTGEIILPNICQTEKILGHRISPKEENAFKIARQLIENYYAWVNNSFGLSLKPRSGDYKNAFELVGRKGATPEKFLKFIQENTDSTYFLKSDKHFSVWTSDISIANYSKQYRDVFIDEV